MSTVTKTTNVLVLIAHYGIEIVQTHLGADDANQIKQQSCSRSTIYSYLAGEAQFLDLQEQCF
jgi:hypothetical protein